MNLECEPRSYRLAYVTKQASWSGPMIRHEVCLTSQWIRTFLRNKIPKVCPFSWIEHLTVTRGTTTFLRAYLPALHNSVYQELSPTSLRIGQTTIAILNSGGFTIAGKGKRTLSYCRVGSFFRPSLVPRMPSPSQDGVKCGVRTSPFLLHQPSPHDQHEEARNISRRFFSYMRTNASMRRSLSQHGVYTGIAGPANRFTSSHITLQLNRSIVATLK